MTDPANKPLKLRSQYWFDNPNNADMTALYLERYLNFGLTRGELQGGKPIIGIAQTGSDLSPCNRAHIDLVKRVRDGIYQAGGIPIEFPVHPMQETGKRPTASLDRNLAYLSIVEVLYGYPLDGVVLTIGCDKTTPACLMAAAAMARGCGYGSVNCRSLPMNWVLPLPFAICRRAPANGTRSNTGCSHSSPATGAASRW